MVRLGIKKEKIELDEIEKELENKRDAVIEKKIPPAGDVTNQH